MWIYLYPLIALIVLLVLSYTDLKRRIAPPKFTYGLLATGMALHAVQSLVTGEVNYFLFAVYGVFTMFLLSYFIYRIGGWAGGDVKLFTALGAILPFYGSLSELTYPLPYPILILAASTISVFPFIMIYGVYKVIGEGAEELKKDILGSLPKSIYMGFIVLASLYLTKIIGVNSVAVFLIAPLIYISKEPGYPLTAFLATLTLIRNTSTAVMNLSYFLIVSIIFVTGIKTYYSVKNNVLREEKIIEDLEEGNIPGEDVWKIEGEIEKKKPSLTRFSEPGELMIDSRKARGLTEKEISFLEEEKIEELEVKKSLPFIPIITLGFILLLVLETFI